MVTSPSLPFRDSERVIYKTNPLTEVICQLRFPTILDIGAREPAEFQNDLRQNYPLYQREEGVSIPKEILQVLSRLPGVRPPEEVIHKFVTAEGDRFVSLNRDFVAVSTTKYARWEAFREQVEVAKTALERHYQPPPPFYTRIGLRYQDLIDRASVHLEDRDWRELISTELLGLLGSGVGSRVAETQAETVLDLNDHVPGGKSRIRHGLMVVEGQQQYLIDIDLFTEARSTDYDVFEALDRFHSIAWNFFRWTITDALHQALQPQHHD